MPFFGFPFFNGFQLFSLAGVATLTVAAIHVVFALGVKKDAEKRLLSALPVVFAPPWAWALSVLVSGLPFLVAYWLFHHAFERLNQ